VSKYARKTDSNQGDVISALSKIGCEVLDLSRVGGGCTDLLVWRAATCTLKLIEVKTPKGKLNALQNTFHKRFAGCTHIARSPMEAVEIMTHG
jgi:hypothetical protein